MVSYAQTDVTLTIHHKLGTEDFAFNQSAVNNLGHDFTLTRLQYYLSEIVLTHDGGTKTAIDDMWILVDASAPTEVDLGNFNVTELEGLAYSVGVDTATNHTDPALYPTGHPLAPVFPSMHWGWASGYRFMALEGYGGPSLDQLMEIHGLGDDNYFEVSHRMNKTAFNNKIHVGIDADYIRLLDDILLINGPIEHGFNREAKKMLENARDFTFTFSSENSGLVDFDANATFNVFPNPTSNHAVSIKLETEKTGDYDIIVHDVLGRSLMSLDIFQNNTHDIKLPQGGGIYYLQLVRNGEVLATQKVLSN